MSDAFGPSEEAHAAHAHELMLRSRVGLRRSIGSPLLFSIVWTSIASAVYFSLGVVAGHALGLTPIVYLVAAAMFGLTTMTYVEGASLHQDRGGATVFARYAFNELVSFAAGWAILLDYVILIAVTAYSATQYLRVFWTPLGRSGVSLVVALAIIVYVVLSNIRGFSTRRARRVGTLVVGDLALQLLLIVLGLVVFFNPHALASTVHLGSAPKWGDLVFALTITTIAFTSLESASGLAGEVAVGRRGLRRLVTSAGVSVLVVYVGIAVVAISAVPVHGTHTALGGRYVDAPVIGIASAFHQHWLSQTLRYVVGAMAALTLVAAANSAMLGLSRLAYSLSTNRQIPSSVGRLHPTRSTPYVLIIIAGCVAAALDRDREPRLPRRHLRLRRDAGLHDRPPVGRAPALLRARARPSVPDAVLGPLSRRVAAHPGRHRRRAVGPRVGGRHRRPRAGALRRPRLDGRRVDPVRRLPPRRGQVAAAAGHRARPGARRGARPLKDDYGSILVPLSGTELDDDIVQTAARLVAGEPTDEAAIDRATIEAVWIFVLPMSLPIDARLPDAQVKRARQALARAKVVGEEYTGRRGGHGDRAGPPRRARDRRGGSPPGGRGDRARRRGAVADPRRAASRRPRRAARELRRRHHQVRRQQGGLPGDRHGAARPRSRSSRFRAPPPRSNKLRPCSS